MRCSIALQLRAGFAVALLLVLGMTASARWLAAGFERALENEHSHVSALMALAEMESTFAQLRLGARSFVTGDAGASKRALRLRPTLLARIESNIEVRERAVHADAEREAIVALKAAYGRYRDALAPFVVPGADDRRMADLEAGEAGVSEALGRLADVVRGNATETFVQDAEWMGRVRDFILVLTGILLSLLGTWYIAAMRALGPLRALRRQMQGMVRERDDEAFDGVLESGNEVAALEAAFRMMSGRLSARTEALRQSRERLDHLLRAAPVMIYSARASASHATTFMSANVLDQLGYAADDFLGDASFREKHIHPDDRSRVREQLAGLEPSEARTLEYRYRHRDGSWRWMRDQVVLLTDSTGMPREVVGAWIDDSARHRAEVAMKEAMRAKVDFMNSVTHELRTPLNGVIGFAELLKEGVPGPLNARQLEFTNDILASGRHLLRLVEGILEMSRLDPAGTVSARESLDVVEVLRERLEAHRDSARSRGVTLRLDPASSAGGTVLLDPRALHRILDALVDNAIKFNRDGGEVTAWVRQAGDAIEIAVADTGIGIARQDLPRLFVPFVQLDAGLSRRQSGVGLGLAIARRLADLLGGTIAVESEPGKGSTFTLRLPIQEKP